MTSPPRILLAGALAAALLAPSSPAGILDVVSWGLDYVMDFPQKEKRDEEPDSSQRNCFCQSALTCICCMDFNLTFIDLGGPGCVRMKYYTELESMAVNISYGDSILHSEMVKGPNPEPTCMNIFSEWAQVCARFKDLSPTEDGMKACLQFEPVLLGEIQTHYHVGCFHMGSSGISFDTPTPIALPESESPKPVVSDGTTVGAAGGEGGISEAELLAAVNESAEEGIAFFSNLLGLTFGGATAGSQNSTVQSQPAESSVPVSGVSTEANLHETSRKN